MTIEGHAGFGGYQTWYRVDGELPAAPDAPAPLVVLHGGPGATHDYLLPLADLARPEYGGRAVVLYDQLGNGRSTHLRERGAERFIAFQTDRDFKLTLNDHELLWGKPVISGTVLYGLAKPGEGEAVFLEVPGGEDRLIEHGELIDLVQPGIERFITARLTFEIIVNSRPRTVNARTVTFEQIVQLAFPGQHEPNVVFSMTYRHAASTPPAGELGVGGSVDVKKKGTVFNVTRTVQS